MRIFGFRFGPWMTFLLFILVIIFLVGLVANFGLDIGKGKQVGIISEVQRNGIFFRQPVITLLNIQSTYSDKDTSYEYGANDSITTLAESFMQNNTKVTVYYETKYLTWAWIYSRRTIITDIQPININQSIVQVM